MTRHNKTSEDELTPSTVQLLETIISSGETQFFISNNDTMTRTMTTRMTPMTTMTTTMITHMYKRQTRENQ
eukprot:9201412-Ditylum_brightwellii.AAC.1